MTSVVNSTSVLARAMASISLYFLLKSFFCDDSGVLVVEMNYMKAVLSAVLVAEAFKQIMIPALSANREHSKSGHVPNSSEIIRNKSRQNGVNLIYFEIDKSVGNKSVFVNANHIIIESLKSVLLARTDVELTTEVIGQYLFNTGYMAKSKYGRLCEIAHWAAELRREI